MIMNKAVQIRKVRAGDEQALAYVQTESWKAAFKKIVPADLLSKCTQLERATAMYKRLLAEQKGNGYMLELDGKPHCIAWWDAARDADMAGFAELICIHSLKAGWHQGYGSLMMQQILADVKSADYAKSCFGCLTAMCAQSNFTKRMDLSPAGERSLL